MYINAGNIYRYKMSRFKFPQILAKQLCSLNRLKLEPIKKNFLVSHQYSTQKMQFVISQIEEIKNTATSLNLHNEQRNIPNSRNPRMLKYGDKPKLISCYLSSRGVPTEKFSEAVKLQNTLRMEHLGNLTGHKSYYLKKELATMEQAIIKYAIKLLKQNDFNIIAVPDILKHKTIEDCGMSTNNERTQVYQIDCDKCLSGTAEMALAGLFSNKIIDQKVLPLRLAAVSRCFRAETSGLQEEKSIYRVHQFTKVEMFAVCTEKQSGNVLESFKEMQLKLFKNLILNFRLLDMPATELGLSAYEKFDIEAWLPDRSTWGEISSCSNCTNYQSSRLNIKCQNKNEQDDIHTVNGTAAAVPRLIMAISDQYKMDSNKQIINVLHKFLNIRKMESSVKLPGIKLSKFIQSQVINNIYTRDY